LLSFGYDHSGDDGIFIADFEKDLGNNLVLNIGRSAGMRQLDIIRVAWAYPASQRFEIVGQENLVSRKMTERIHVAAQEDLQGLIEQTPDTRPATDKAMTKRAADRRLSSRFHNHGSLIVLLELEQMAGRRR
jgi:hypothetical protein